MITPGEPGKLAPYALNAGVLICISYHNDGRLSPRCGSLHNIGAPLFVFFPLTTQLLLPLPGSGLKASLICIGCTLRYNESADAGAFGKTFCGRNGVPFGMIGSSESCTSGNNFAKSSALK